MIKDFLVSWKTTDSDVNSTAEILTWIQKLNGETKVNIQEISVHKSSFWFYDDYKGEILNRKRSFFSITGMRYFRNDRFLYEQPVILQPEIGYLGIICQKINGVLHFLMQAKIEPGNINCVQISPTIQATKSNFTRAHGGNLPHYFDYFEQSRNHHVIYDQIQSEQSSRFYHKRNRNMVMLVEEAIEVLPNFKWMTLGQIKELLKIDNLVNMDTRTVLSGIPFIGGSYSEAELAELEALFTDKALFKSIFQANPLLGLPKIYQAMNDFKMFEDITCVPVSLNQLVDWEVSEHGLTSRVQSPFMVRYYDISISGREVSRWDQPLFKAIGMATFGLMSSVIDGKRQFLVSLKPEIGSFDKVEVGPTVQWEATHYLYNDDPIEALFRKHMENSQYAYVDVILSEEGGRFHHEQNRNVILDLPQQLLTDLPDGYFWVDFATLNYIIQINNTCNIQLRNLLSLIKL